MLSLAAAFGGCAVPHSAGEYFGNRGRDFLDCWRFSTGIAIGIHARGDALFFPAGLGYSGGWKAGLGGAAGAEGFCWRQVDLTLTLPPFSWLDIQARGVDKDAPVNPFAIASDANLWADSVRSFGSLVTHPNRGEGS